MKSKPRNPRSFRGFIRAIFAKPHVSSGKLPSIPKGKTTKEGQKLHVEPLSRITLRDATKLVKKVFPKQGMEPAWLTFRASLGTQPFSFIVKRKIDFLKYWVAVDKGKLLGVTGIYTYKGDKESVWGGWTCIEPNIMGSLSRASFLLIQRAFGEAKKLGRKRIRLYTSTSPVEEAANRIYRKVGFKVFRTQPIKGTQYVINYMELDLTKPNPELSRIESLGRNP